MDTSVIKVTHECYIHATATHRVLLRRSGKAPYSYAELQGRLRDIFGIPHFAQFILTYKDTSGHIITIATEDELNDAMNLDLTLTFCMNIVGDYPINLKCPMTIHNLAVYCVQLDLGRISRRMNLAPGHSDFSFEHFQIDIRSVFELPPSAHFVLTYPDPYLGHSYDHSYRGGNAFEDKITISNAEELKIFLAKKRFDERRDRFGSLSLTIQMIGHVKIDYNGTFRLLTLSPNVLEFSYKQLESSIRDLFKFSKVSRHRLQLTYVDVRWDHITITRSEEVKDVLVMLSINRCPLMVTLPMQEEGDNDGNINPAILENSDSDGVMVVHEDSFRILTSGELKLSYAELASHIRDLFQLPVSAQFELNYEQIENEILHEFTISKSDEELKDTLLSLSKSPLRLRLYVAEEDSDVESDSPKNASPFVVTMVMHTGDVQHVTFPAGEIVSDESESLFEKFRSGIRDRFNLPDFVEFVLTYVNEDGDNINMSKDADLQHAMTLKKLSDDLQVNLEIASVQNQNQMKIMKDASETNTEA